MRKLDVKIHARDGSYTEQFHPEPPPETFGVIIQQQHSFLHVTRIAVETLKIHNLCEFHEWRAGALI